jgi:hypothetical protein
LRYDVNNPSKERTKAHSNQKLKNAFRKKLPGEKKFPSDTDSGMVTIISVCIKNKSLLGKEIYGYFENFLTYYSFYRLVAI